MYARRKLLVVLPVILAVIFVGVGGSARAARKATPAPSTTATVPGYADIVWLDGTTETIAIGNVPAGLSGQQLVDAGASAVAARARAEGRPAPPIVSPRTTSSAYRPARRQDDQYYYYDCVWTLDMHLVNFSTLYGGAYISCSPGVYETDSTVWLWRGLWNLIGYSNGVGYPNEINGTVGTCSPGTNSYTDELDYTMYTPAGADYHSHSGSHNFTC